MNNHRILFISYYSAVSLPVLLSYAVCFLPPSSHREKKKYTSGSNLLSDSYLPPKNPVKVGISYFLRVTCVHTDVGLTSTYLPGVLMALCQLTITSSVRQRGSQEMLFPEFLSLNGYRIVCQEKNTNTRVGRHKGRRSHYVPSTVAARH